MTNFWDALELADQTQPEVDLEYRLYYNDLGEVLFYSTEGHPGNYIVITKQVYDEGRYDNTVVDGVLVPPAQYIYQKLIPNEFGTTTITSDVSIVGSEQHWKLKRYE
jgi:hypothetical protein